MTNNLEFLREEKDLLSKDIAKTIQVTTSVYSEWENNKLSIPTERIYELSEFFAVNADYLIGLTPTRIKLQTNKKLNNQLAAKRVKEARLSMNLTMRDLANKLNTSSSAISNYENNKNLILSSFLIELSTMSNYSLDYLLGRTNLKHIKKR